MASTFSVYNSYRILDRKTGEYVRHATRDEIDASWLQHHSDHRNHYIDLGNGRQGFIVADEDSGRHTIEVPCDCGKNQPL